MRNTAIGLLIGVIFGIIDCVVFIASGQSVTLGMGASAIAFWATVGWATHSVPTALPAVPRGVLIAAFFNLPWVIEFTLNQGMGELFVPMVVMALVLGAGVGFVSGLAGRRWKRDMEGASAPG